MKKMTAEKAWNLIKQINWGKEADYVQKAKVWWKQLGKETMEELSDFVRTRVSDLALAVAKYENENGIRLMVGSDDGFSDLRYHVVGLGQNEFDLAMANPKRLEERYLKGDYKESFAYVFLEPIPARTATQRERTIMLLVTNLVEVEKQIWDLERQLETLRGSFQDVNRLLNQIIEDSK